MIENISFRSGISDWEDKGLPGSFKFGSNLDIRKFADSLSCNQALIDEGVTHNAPSSSLSPSASYSPSASNSPSASPSVSPSSSVSPSIKISPSASLSPSASNSPSASSSPSASLSPSSSVSPSPSPSAGLKTVFADLIRHFVKASDGNVYGFGNTGKVYKRTSDHAWYQVYDLHKEIKGAEEKPSSDGSTYLVFASNTEVHIKRLPGLSNWNDVDVLPGFPKTNLTSADWHTMKQIAGDVLIANGNTLAFIGFDANPSLDEESYTNNGLQLIPGNIAKCIIERSGRSIIGTYRASDPTKGTNAMVDSEVPLMQVGDQGELYYADMADTMPIKTFPGGGKVNPGGAINLVDQVNVFEWDQISQDFINKQALGNLALFGVYGATTGKGGVYSYGRRNKNQSMAMNLEYQFDCDEIGAMTVMNGILLFSYRIGTTFGVMAVDQNNKATATWESLDFKSPTQKTIDICHYSMTEVYMSPLPANCSIQFWYRMNKIGNFVQATTADGQSSFSTTGAKTAMFRIGAEGQIYERRIVLVPSGNLTPEVFRTRTYFKLN